MNKPLFVLVALLLFWFDCESAMAQQQVQPWTVGLTMTSLRTNFDGMGLNTVAVPGAITPWTGPTYVPPQDSGLKLQVGRKLDDYFSLHGSYMGMSDLGNYAGMTPSPWGMVNSDVRISGWNADVLGNMPLPGGTQGFGRMGLMYSTARTYLGASSPGLIVVDRSNRFVPGFGFGTDTQFYRALSLHIEYDHYFRLGDTVTFPQVSSDLLTVGVNFHF